MVVLIVLLESFDASYESHVGHLQDVLLFVLYYHQLEVVVETAMVVEAVHLARQRVDEHAWLVLRRL